MEPLSSVTGFQVKPHMASFVRGPQTQTPTCLSHFSLGDIFLLSSGVWDGVGSGEDGGGVNSNLCVNPITRLFEVKVMLLLGCNNNCVY